MIEATPMMRQYYDIKAKHHDSILMFRLGDFYEMFEDDAIVASKVLDITLTSRDGGRLGRIPMCGVPHHAAEGYIAGLVKAGHRVAICEQVEDPKEAKGVVQREVVRIITPGTVLDAGLLDARQNNYLAVVSKGSVKGEDAFGFAFCDPSTGEFSCTQISGAGSRNMLREELLRIMPAELILSPELSQEDVRTIETAFLEREGVLITKPDDMDFRPVHASRRIQSHFRVQSLDGFGCADLPLAVTASAGIIQYLELTHKTALAQITRLTTYSVSAHMLLDHATRRNLELVRTLRTNERRGSLLWLLDETKTAMGGRLLKGWITRPLVSENEILLRLNATEDLVNHGDLRFEIQNLLEQVADIERLTGRVAYGSANGRDLKAIQLSLQAIPGLKSLLLNTAQSERLQAIASEMDPCEELAEEISRTIVDEPPVSVTEGGLIRRGYHEELDGLHEAINAGKQWVTDLERSERERTGIKSLKVSFNKVFGYYIEVTRANLHLVPDEYERRQTLANAERFITPELKQREATILGAEERIVDLEYELFIQLRDKVVTEIPRLQSLAKLLAELDVYTSFAQVSVDKRYRKPVISNTEGIHITGGRHPVVEALQPGGDFVPNDVSLGDTTQVILLTGPNMAGKSTFLRQVALIVLLAQIGCFVPADEATIGLVDRIFTRVGASDDLATGQSTFMVEMNEVANILNHATKHSLIILDEVGRGTSTFDGVSIAWAVTEHLHNVSPSGPKTLFATHYHELTQLADELPRVKNFTVAVHKHGNEIVFLRRIIEGSADQSYGIEVARLAGLPGEVINRAKSILLDLESGKGLGQTLTAATTREDSRTERPVEDGFQLSLFQQMDPLIMRLSEIDPDGMTPLDALNLLAELTGEIEKRGNAG